MNTNKLKKRGNKIAKEYIYEFGNGSNAGRDKIGQAILKHVRVLPKDQRDFLVLYIDNKIDCKTEKIEEILKEIRDEIKMIKKELYTNGKE